MQLINVTQSKHCGLDSIVSGLGQSFVHSEIKCVLPLCTLHYYTDVMESKGLVLMRGEVNRGRLPLENAQFMTHQVQIFYLDNDVSICGRCIVMLMFLQL